MTLKALSPQTLAGLFALLLASPSMALAQAQGAAATPSDPAHEETVREARALFELAHIHYEAGRYAEAARELEQAFALSPRPQLLYDLHLAYRDLGDSVHSADALRRYLGGSSDIEPGVRRTLERRLSGLELTIATQQVAVTPPPEVTPPPDITPPPDVTPHPNVPEVTPPSDVTAPELAMPRAHHNPDFTAADFAFGVGGVGLLTMGIFGGLAQSSVSNLRSTCAPNCTTAQVDEARTFALASDVGLGVGIVGASVGLALLIVALNESPSSTPDAPLQVSGGFDEHGGYVTASGSF